MMRTVLTYVIALCLALWLGGLIFLFIALISVFKAEYALGTRVGPILFTKFEPYQLALAAITIACTIGWRLYACSRSKKILLACLLGAAIISAVEYSLILPRMLDLWAQKSVYAGRAINDTLSNKPTTNTAEQTIAAENEAEFQRLHLTSQTLYYGITILVLLSGGAFVASVRGEQEIRLPRPTDRD